MMTTEKANAHGALTDMHDKGWSYDHDYSRASRTTQAWRGPRAQDGRDDGARVKTQRQQPRNAQLEGEEGTTVRSYCT